MVTIDVEIVGAGPYGLSIASHLRSRGIEHRIFGAPMLAWRTQMPQGMFLKSEGFASDLYDPDSTFHLKDYCEAQGLPYADLGLPISREVFADYGVAFQRRFVPHLETTDVVAIDEVSGDFRLTLATGEVLTARRVVLAVGISHFAHVPSEIATLPRTLVSHSSNHCDLSGFSGLEVAVLGAGASALDCAALLVKANASVRLIARAPEIHFHNGTDKLPRPLKERLRWPSSGLGYGWKSLLYTDLPLLFHALPERLRLQIVRNHLGPAPGWWTREMVEGKVRQHLGQTLRKVSETGARIQLEMEGADGASSTVAVDHVIAATGYRADVDRLSFLGQALRARIRRGGEAPALSRNFESSVRGLYFVGPAAANSFGPLARFAFGAGFTARRLARHLDHREAAPGRVRERDGEAFQLAAAVQRSNVTPATITAIRTTHG
jgi:cation diffusion facilitator CzcD-associated flavoprotein CzcO